MTLEAEQAILGSIIVDNNVYVDVSTYLAPADFSEELHRRVFEYMGDLLNTAGVISIPDMGAFLDGLGRVGDLSMREYFARLAHDAAGAKSPHGPHYDLRYQSQQLEAFAKQIKWSGLGTGWSRGLYDGFSYLLGDLASRCHGVGDSPIERQLLLATAVFNTVREYSGGGFESQVG